MTTYDIGSPDWLIPTIVATILLLLITLRNYAKYWFGGWAAPALFLKITGIIILAVCLIEPMGRGERPRPQANVLPILVDTSESMKMRTSGMTASSAQRIAAALESNAAWYQQIEQLFDVRPSQFGERLDSLTTFDELTFDAAESNLRTSLETISTRFQGRPVAGLLLMTDGNLTDDIEFMDWSSLPFPVFPVYDANASLIADLRFGHVTVSETDFETAPITIDTTLIHQNLPNQEISILLKDATNQIIAQQQLTTNETQTQPVRFRFRPEKSGVSFFHLECFVSGEEDSLETDKSDIEATLANNSKLIAINQRRGPYKVLYVAGRPNWEFKYLRRALDEDAEVRLVGLLRLAKKQPKFSFRDSNIQSSANPLFAGLGGEEEEIAEQSDEPVLIPIGVKEATELADGFPSNAETLFPFSAIIIDDLEASFFTQDQLLLLRQFVSTRGGALLILGGEDSLEKGNFEDSALADLAPVYLANNAVSSNSNNFEDQIDGPSGQFKMQLTREGLLQPFLRLRGTEQAEAQRLSNAPPLKVLNRAARIKPGAVTLATAVNSGGQALPAIVSQSFGRGKTVAMMFGDVWRWSLQDGIAGRTADASVTPKSEDDPAQVWRQLVRWLISDVQRPVTISTQPTDVPSVLRLIVDVKDAQFAPLDGANVRIEVSLPDGTEIELNAEADAEKLGRYSSEVWSRRTGGYIANVSVTTPDDSLIGTAQYGWTSDPAAKEFETLGMNTELLTKIAKQTGGEVIDFDSLDSFASSLSSRPVPITETWTFPLWHRWWILSLAIACLCGEWGIRRWRGLP